MFLSGLKCLSRLERQVKFAKNRCCKIKPVAVTSEVCKKPVLQNKTVAVIYCCFRKPKGTTSPPRPPGKGRGSINWQLKVYK